MKTTIVFVLLLLTSYVSAEEVDPFFNLEKPPLSSTAGINLMINDELKLFAENFNSSKKECTDRKALTDDALYFFDKNFSSIGNKIRDIETVNIYFRNNRSGRDLPRKVLNDSERYAKYNISLYPLIHKEESIFNKTSVRGCCISQLNISGMTIGIDKFDHFFGNGGLLWEEYLSNSSKITDKNILQLSTNQEHGTWGLLSMNLKSYGDLSSNWQGFQFYRSLFSGDKPYFQCKDEKLTLVRKFDILEYADDSWDESINCASYSSPEIAEVVAQNIKKRNQSCPRVQSKCEALKEKYKVQPDVYRHIISPGCRNGIQVKDLVENSSSASWKDLLNVIGGSADFIENKIWQGVK